MIEQAKDVLEEFSCQFDVDSKEQARAILTLFEVNELLAAVGVEAFPESSCDQAKLVAHANWGSHNQEFESRLFAPSSASEPLAFSHREALRTLSEGLLVEIVEYWSLMQEEEPFEEVGLRWIGILNGTAQAGRLVKVKPNGEILNTEGHNKLIEVSHL